LFEEGEIMSVEEKPKQSTAGLTYGFIVYWGTIIGSIISAIGTVVVFTTQHNMAKPSYWITSIWKGESTRVIWEGIIDSPMVGHWYLQNLSFGDSLSAFGISVGVFSVTLAMVVTACVLFKKKSYTFGILALLAALITSVSLLALLPLPC